MLHSIYVLASLNLQHCNDGKPFNFNSYGINVLISVLPYKGCIYEYFEKIKFGLFYLTST